MPKIDRQHDGRSRRAANKDGSGVKSRKDTTERDREELLRRERIDVTIPGRGVRHGRLHPVTQICQKITPSEELLEKVHIFDIYTDQGIPKWN